MRVLIFHPILEKNKLSFYLPLFFYQIKKIQTNKVLFIDIVNDIDEFEYLTYIREYEVLYFFFEEEFKFKYLNALKWVSKNQYNLSCVLLVDESKLKYSKEFKNEMVRKYNLIEIPYNENSFLKREAPLDEVMLEILKSKMLKISNRFKLDYQNKKIYFINNLKEKILVPLKKKIDFNTLHCFILNQGKVLSVEKLSNFVSNEPEQINDLIITNSITTVRKHLRKVVKGSDVDIVSSKKIGYELVIKTL